MKSGTSRITSYNVCYTKLLRNKDFDFIYYDEIETSDLENIKNYANDYDSIIGIGGGRPIDIGKLIAHKSKKPFLSVPTTASNDGIASPIVSLTQLV